MRKTPATAHNVLVISGGSINRLFAYGTIIFDGYDFAMGSGLSWGIDGKTILGTGILSGKWFDGTSWTTNIVENYDTATIMAIPEPCSLVLLSLGGLMFRRKK